MAKKVTILPDKDYDPRRNIQSDINQQMQKRNITQSTKEEKRGSGIWWWLIWLIVMALVKTATKTITDSTRKTNTPTYTYNNSYNNYK